MGGADGALGLGHGAVLELDVGGEKQELGGTKSWQNQEAGWPV